MERYLKRKEPFSSSPSDIGEESSRRNNPNIERSRSTFATPITVDDMNNLPWDPSERPRILKYNPNQRDEIRRRYWIRGPCQPRSHTFPQTKIGNRARRFVSTWFDKYGNWLEYSVKADKAFCLCCYLFRDDVSHQGGNEAFVTQGFNGWNKTERLDEHVGEINSFHNRALQKCEDLVRQNQSIQAAIHKKNEIDKKEYAIRLKTSLLSTKYLLNGALPFRGHDESESSFFRGHYLELIKLIASQNEIIGEVTLKNAPGNDMLVAPSIQKDMCQSYEEEVLKIIFDEIGDGVFALLVDESSDVSKKEQMAIVFRYVDRCGFVKESFVGLVHVKDTSASSLKSAIDNFFVGHSLSLNQVRGQGYDGASNMRGQFNGLKAKILEENNSAYYIHCFAHQLQLVVVAVARKHLGVLNFFEKLSLVANVVCASCKRKDILLDLEKERVEMAIGNGEVETGSGKNQGLSLLRPGDTRWSSHYQTILRLIVMFSSVIKVLEFVEEEGTDGSSQNKATGILTYFESFDFVFHLHLMKHIFGLTDMLSQALQRKDQDIVRAVSLVKSTKKDLKDFRLKGFDSLLKKISSFCEKHDIPMVKMEEAYVNPKGRRQRVNITNQHYYEFDCFNTIVDMQIQEFGDRFSEATTELIENMAALNPHKSFSEFDASKLVRLSDFYPNDFDSVERMNLEDQLDLYYDNVSKDERFANLNGIADLAKEMVKTRKHLSYHLVYRLLKLALVLPVATATVERCFSAMKLVKSDLRNRIGDEFLNSCVICSVEKEVLARVKIEDVMARFHKLGKRRGRL